MKINSPVVLSVQNLEYVPLEPCPLGVEIVRERCCNEDVAQHARAVSSTNETQHLPRRERKEVRVRVSE